METTCHIKPNIFMWTKLLENLPFVKYLISSEAVVQRCCKKGVLRNFAKFTGKHLCQSLFFNKVAGWGTIFYRIPLMAASISFTARTRFVIFLHESIYGFTLTLWEDILKNVWETLLLKNFEIWYWQICVDVLSSFS